MTTERSKQMAFDLPVRTAMGREAFSVSASNAQAVAMIDAWKDWPKGKLALVGPAGSGKTHLASVWSELTGAQIISAAQVANHPLPEQPGSCLVVEDVPQIAGDTQAEEALFHLHNAMASGNGFLLLTGDAAPAHWALALPDLASRMQASTVAALSPPDDALLTHVLVKLFQDRQIVPPAQMIEYLVIHMERSFAEAGRIVAEIDRRALESNRKINRKLAVEVLG